MRRPRELDPSLLLDRRGRALRVAAALSLGVALAPLPASAQQVDAAPGPSPTPSAAPKQEAPSAPDPVPETPKPTPASLAAPEPPKPPSGFGFGSYGRVIAATDFRGRPGRNADIVARGSRLDEGNYMEIELNRSDYWAKTDSSTRIVATLAITNPIFHYSGDFNVKMAVRNLFIESYDLGLKGMSVWAGSRMYRGDDIYLLDFWPLDNLNTLGGGARYDILKNTFLALQFGVSQPFSGFYVQDTSRPNVYNQLGAATVRVLDRQRFVGSAKASHIFPIGEGGIKVVAYGEGHFLPQGQREERAGVFETLPSDDGYVIGGQISAYTGQRSTHLNIYGRYARGLAAYGDPVSTPSSLAADETTRGAHEFLFAVGGNWEIGPFGLLFGSYYRIFRNASPSLDFNDLNEGIVALRPQVFFGEIGGLAVEGSYQAQQRGAIAAQSTVDDGQQASGPARGSLWRFGVIPFLSPAGRGSFSRPQLRLIYVMALRDQGARSLYPQDDVYSLRQIEHFFGFGAEWWFNSSSYSR